MLHSTRGASGHWLPALVAGAAAGFVWAALPAWLAVARGVPEILTTLMLNGVALEFGNGGGYTVPTELAAVVDKTLKMWGPMYDEAICNVLGVSATNLRVLLHRRRLVPRPCRAGRAARRRQSPCVRAPSRFETSGSRVWAGSSV